MTKKTVLKNGLTVITEHNDMYHSTLLTYWAKAGGDYEKNYPHGIAHFLEHMMFKGTPTRTKDQIKEEIDGIGGNVNASTWQDKTRYYTVVPHDQWGKGTAILTDMLFHSLFPLDEIEKEKKVVLEEIKMSQDNLGGYSYRLMIQHIFKHHPERQSVLGTPDSVSSITKQDLHNFMNEFYQPNNLVFVATGNINHEQLCAFLESIVPSTSSTHQPSTVTPFQPWDFNGKTILVEKDIQQANIRWALLAESKRTPDYYALSVISTLLGGSMSSRFFKKIREEKGLAYSLNVSYGQMLDIGFMSGFVATTPSNVEIVKQLIVEELDSLKTVPVGEDELEKVKNLKIGRYFISKDYKEDINYDLAVDHMYGKVDTPEVYAQNIRAVTSEDILRVANRYFGKEKMLFIDILPKSK